MEYIKTLEQFDWKRFEPSKWGFDVAPGSYTGVYEVYMSKQDTIPGLSWFFEGKQVSLPSPTDEEALKELVQLIDAGLAKVAFRIVRERVLNPETHELVLKVTDLVNIILMHPKLDQLMGSDGSFTYQFARTLAWLQRFQDSTNPFINPRLN